MGAIRKKISELTPSTAFNGLWTIGVDALNRSVRVSLQYIADTIASLKSGVETAINNADKATQRANTAATNADNSRKAIEANEQTRQSNEQTRQSNEQTRKNNETTRINNENARKQAENARVTSELNRVTEHATLKKNAEDATKAANDAAEEALTAAANANAAKEQALQMANAANTAAGNANTQAAAASAATIAANTAAEEALTAKEETISATELCQALIDAASQVTSLGLLPTGMTVEYPEELTLGNLAEIFIRAKLQPGYSLPNIMYLGDNNAVSVAPDGRITINHEGVSVIHVIPTGNTQLYKTISIRVKCAGLAFVKNRNTAMLLSSGNFLFN